MQDYYNRRLYREVKSLFDEDERFVTSDFISEDAEIEVGLRPRNLSEYIGQEKAKNNLAESAFSVSPLPVIFQKLFSSFSTT